MTLHPSPPSALQHRVRALDLQHDATVAELGCPAMQVSLGMLRAATRRAPIEAILAEPDRTTAALRAAEPSLRRAWARYLAHVVPTEHHEALQRRLMNHAPKLAEDYVTVADNLRAQAEAKGLQRGHDQGLQHGLEQGLRRALYVAGTHLGEPTSAQRQRIQALSQAAALQALERVARAACWDDVLGR